MTIPRKRITIAFPGPPQKGGPGSFQNRLARELQGRGYQIYLPGIGLSPAILLVVGGTAKVGWLWRTKRKGARVVQRLDGINWRHRVTAVSPWQFLLSEFRNWLMVLTRNFLADHVVYQSEFVKNWWHRKYGPAPCLETVIYNGVDLTQFTPEMRESPNGDRPVVLCVEGNVQDDPVTVKILTTVAKRLFKEGIIERTEVYGGVSAAIRSRLAKQPGIRLRGVVPREEMPRVFSQAGTFLVLEINPPCPNSVIESLASGLPVVGFDTGSLRELVPPEAGMIVPYGGDPWKLEEPDLPALRRAVKQVLARRADYGKAARSLAERRFGLDNMVESYLRVFDEVLG